MHCWRGGRWGESGQSLNGGSWAVHKSVGVDWTRSAAMTAGGPKRAGVVWALVCSRVMCHRRACQSLFAPLDPLAQPSPRYGKLHQQVVGPRVIAGRSGRRIAVGHIANARRGTWSVRGANESPVGRTASGWTRLADTHDPTGDGARARPNHGLPSRRAFHRVARLSVSNDT